MKKNMFLTFLLTLFMFVGCDPIDNFNDFDEQITNETDETDVNLEKLCGTWQLTECINSNSTEEIAYRDFTLTFEESGYVIKRYIGVEEIEM